MADRRTLRSARSQIAARTCPGGHVIDAAAGFPAKVARPFNSPKFKDRWRIQA